MVHVNSGRLKVLATTGARRLATLPNVPTVAETFPGFEALNWFIVVAPAGTPATIIERLNDACVQALRSDAMRQVLERDGLNAVGNSRVQAQQFLRNEFTKWDKIVRDKNLSAD
jgi:tripartite-type tricarboxylate transporter receptor subunit TctC